uniref:Uncharacterized protein n=1 Tax=uncultured prokaryote TaxID=198431 RepID=A0A0H5Q4B3_9ZZZZ|nr:hypothetical protein [uncultured prokaryote]
MAGEGLEGAVAGQVGRLLCKVFDDDGSADALLAKTYGRNGAAIVGAPVRYSKRLFKDSFCGDEAPEDTPGGQYLPDGLPAAKGQCLKQYSVKMQINVYDTIKNRAEFSTGTVFGPGPISGYNARVVGTGYRAFVTFADGEKQATSIYKYPEYELRGYEILEVKRVDGLPDDCGSSPDNRPRYEGPVTYDGPDGPVTTNVNIVVGAPRSDKGGKGLTIPFAWIAPELNLKGKLEIDPEGELNLNPSFGEDGRPRIDPNSPQAPSGPDDPPPPGDSREIVGVVVVTQKIQQATTTTEYGDGFSPNLYLPRCASLIFAVNVVGVGSWMAPIDVETLRQWIPVPGDFPAYSAVVKPMNGYTCQVFPAYLDDGDDEEGDEE